MNKMFYNNGQKYSNHRFSKSSIDRFFYSESCFLSLGNSKAFSKFSVSHRLGCYYTFFIKKSFTNAYKDEVSTTLPGYYSYNDTYDIYDKISFTDGFNPFYGFRVGFRIKKLMPRLGLELMYSTNRATLTSNTQLNSVTVITNALVIKLTGGITF